MLGLYEVARNDQHKMVNSPDKGISVLWPALQSVQKERKKKSFCCAFLSFVSPLLTQGLTQLALSCVPTIRLSSKMFFVWVSPRWPHSSPVTYFFSLADHSLPPLPKKEMNLQMNFWIRPGLKLILFYPGNGTDGCFIQDPVLFLFARHSAAKPNQGP